MELELVLFFICLCLSGFFSGSESAMLASSRLKIRALADQGHRSAKVLDRLLEAPQRLLATILIGNNIVNTATASLATLIVAQMLKPSGFSDGAVVTFSTIVATVFLLVVGEITPKGVAVVFPEKVALRTAPILAVMQAVLRPLVIAFTLLNVLIEKVLRVQKNTGLPGSPEELRQMAVMLTDAGLLGKHQVTMLENVIELSDTYARDVMIPRTEVAFIPNTADTAQLLAIFREKRHTRYPVYDAEKGLDEIVGVLHVHDLMAMLPDEWTPEKLNTLARKRPPIFVPEFKKVGLLFRELQLSRHHVAIVVDEYGGTAGLVTIEDIVEEIVGEIFNEFEPVPIRRLNARTYLCQGTVKLEDIAEELGIQFADTEDVDSLAGYVFTRLGRLPEQGERLNGPGVTLTVLKVEGTRIKSIQLARHTPSGRFPIDATLRTTIAATSDDSHRLPEVKNS